ncbi:MAG TPA: DNA translocase FtsK, partial [Candidatus Acidoferrales bacterium]|nr:DNA translocase FtsK [Candidatus Acidoferrales bacterium]
MKFLSQVFVPTGSKRLNELIGFLCFVCATLLVLSLVSYSPLDPSLNTSARPVTPRDIHNWIGVAGAALADVLLQLLGVSAFLIPVFVFMFGVRWFRSLKIESAVAKSIGCLMLMLFLGAVLALLPWGLRLRGAVPAAGIFGRILGDLLLKYLNTTGAYIVALAALAVGLYLTTAFSFGALKLWLETRFAFVFALRERYLDWKERRARKNEQRLLERKRIEQQKTEELARKEKEKAAQRSAVIAAPEPPLRGVVQQAPVPGVPVPEPQYVDLAPKASVKSGIERMLEEGGVATAVEEASAPTVGTRADEARRARTTMPRTQGGYKLPPSSLLHRPDARNEFDTQELHDLAQVLTQKCAEFDVRGSVTQINPGPVVTTFEFKPEAGIKYSRIVNLQDDLCLALRAESILIERMAGKSTVGIQVPNEKRETIWLREVIESEDFVKSPSKLTLALGKDINGRIGVTELNSMPHLLIAGSTGSGKSVAINAFIMSILYKATPDQVRLILVDPKRVELGNYAEVPHLLVPIVSEPKQAANILRNAVREMERRLKLLAQKGVRNIDQYNKLFEGGTTPSLFEDGEEEKPLPYIVIIVDELADLMMVDGANVEESITRLAQMARAIGIHLVLATQRPSVDVITGLIKANFPARMSFRVATKIDSRTILDANGAEHLLGKGDMLYLPSGSARVHRMHAPFVTEKEIAATVEFWKKQSTAEYEEGYLAAPAGEG